MKIKNITLLVGIVFLLILAAYKYNEWYVFSSLDNFHKSFFSSYLQLNEKEFKLNEEAYKLTETLTEDLKDKKKAKDAEKNFWTGIIRYSKININNTQETISLLNSNSKVVSKIKQHGAFLIGRNRKLVSDYLKLVTNYLDINLQQKQLSLASDNYGLNYSQIQLDYITISKFDTGYNGKSLAGIQQYVQNNFSDISDLEKYSRSNFEYEQADLIKSSMPESYDHLQKVKAFIGSYYEMMKDLASGDSESAGYKWDKFNSNRINLNVNAFELDKAVDKKKEELTKNLLNSEKELIDIVSTLNKRTYKYPFIKTNFAWNDTLLKCDFILSSTQYYKIMTDDYPTQATITELINELDNKGMLLGSFQYDESKIKYQRDDKKIAFTCFDDQSNKELVFSDVIVKNTEESKEEK